MTDLLTVKELAARLSVKVNTVYYWVERHEIPVLRVGKHLRFRYDDVIASFEKKTTEHRERCTGPSDFDTPPGSSLKKRGRLTPTKEE